MYGVYRAVRGKKNIPIYCIAVCEDKRTAKRVCAEYRKVMAINGHKKTNRYFYRKLKAS